MTEAAAPLRDRARFEWLTAPPLPIRFGLKWAATVCASLWLAHAYDLPHGVWITITVIFVMQPVSSASVSKALLRLAGTVLAAFVSIAVYGAFAQAPPMLLGSLFVCVVAGVYLMTGPHYQYAGHVFAFTTVIILVSALAAPEQAVETIAFERGSMVALGILLVFVADATFWPVGVGARIREGLATGAERTGALLIRSLGDLASGRRGDPPAQHDPTALVGQLQLASQYRMELGVSRAEADSAARVAALLEALDFRARDLFDFVAARPAEPLGPALAEAVDDLARTIDAAVGRIRSTLAKARSRASDHPSEAHEALERVAALRVDAVDTFLARADEPNTAADREALVRDARASGLLRDLVGLLERIEAELPTFLALRRDSEASPVVHSGWSLPRVDPLRLQLAMRAGLAASIAILLVISFGWAVNSVGVIVAFTASAAPTRTAGIKLGIGVMAAGLAAWALADLGIVFVYTHIDQMPLALAFVFALMLAFGYVAAAKPKLAPLAALAGLMTILPIFGGAAAPQNVEAPYDTAVYLFWGVSTGLLAQHLFWPRTARQLFWLRAAGQLGICRGLIVPTDPSVTSLEVRTSQALAACATGLTMLGQLDDQARQEVMDDPEEDQRRAALLTRVQALFDGALRDVAAPDWTPSGTDPSVAVVARAVQTRDQKLLESVDWAIAAVRGENCGPPPDLARAQAEVEDRLESARSEAAPAAELRDATARIDSRRELARDQLALQDWLSGWPDSEGDAR